MATKLASLRSLNNDFARAYKYEIQIQNITLFDGFKTKLNDGVTNHLKYSCLNVVMPNEGIQTIETEIGSHTLKVHGRKEKGGTISPEFLIDGTYTIYKFFREWQNAANPDNKTSNETQALNSDLLTTVTIVGKDVTNTTQLSCVLENVWCRNAPEINFADDSNDIIRWAPELVYEFSRVNYGPEAKPLT